LEIQDLLVATTRSDRSGDVDDARSFVSNIAAGCAGRCEQRMPRHPLAPLRIQDVTAATAVNDPLRPFGAARS